MTPLRLTAQKGQTILEYTFLLMVVVLPVAAAVRYALEDSEGEGKKNLVHNLVKDAYGAKNQMGVVGRPY
jgi:uncharacterized protein (UPF0333 family)